MVQARASRVDRVGKSTLLPREASEHERRQAVLNAEVKKAEDGIKFRV